MVIEGFVRFRVPAFFGARMRTYSPLPFLLSEIKFMSEVSKQKLMRTIRRLGLMGCAEKMRETFVRLRSGGSNRAFIARHPDFPLPPSGMMHDPYGVVDYAWYWESGKNAAAEISKVIGANCAAGKDPLKILEWGCGPARIIRHLAPVRAGSSFECFGTDYNTTMIDWCRAASRR